MTLKLEKTCKCIQEWHPMNDGKISTTILNFYKDREYQVNIEYLHPYTEAYIVFNNGGWDDYVTIDNDTFNKYFELIE